jgi:CheY-like chemotaxis protein
MTHDVSFTVATLGFDERERAMFRDLLRISEHRSPTFSTHSRSLGLLPHIVIVDADRPDALERWQAFRRANERSGRLSGVMLSTRPLAEPAKYALRRPVILAQLFSLLERIVSEVQGFQPPAAPSNAQSLFVLSPDELPSVPTVVERAISPPAPVPLPALQPAVEVPIAAEYAATEIAVIMEAPTNGGADAEVVQNTPIDNAIAAASAPAASAAPPAPAAAAATVARAAVPNTTSFATKALAEASAMLTAASKSRVSSSVERPAPVALAKVRILVVDDSLPVRIQMKTALESFTKTIDFADNGDQAVLLIDSCKYDVIFLDVIMPGRDGYDVCRYIRRHAVQKKTPVIMLTGNSSPADRVKGKLAGCDTYLIKPVRQSVLAEVIGDFIKPLAAA